MKPITDYITPKKRQTLDRLWLSLAAVVTVLFVAAMAWGR